MLTRQQAIDLADKHDLLEDMPNYENIIKALIEASRGDFHLKVKAAGMTKQGFNDWRNP